MKIAITGSIGSGKSTVCEYLISKGYDVFDCDKENAILLEKGNEGYENVKKYFPECFDGEKLDKQKLSDIVFEDEDRKKILECFMHPLILERLNERKDNPLFAEVPLLFEVGWDEYFDKNILVVTDMDIIYQRLVEKGMNPSEIENRLKNQMSVEEKIKRADKIIYNNGSLSELYACVDQVLQEIL